MYIIKLAFRRFLRHWKLYIFVLLGLSFASGLMACLPIYSQALALQSLNNSLAIGHPIERNIEVSGSNDILSGGLFRFIDELIGDLYFKRLEIRKVYLDVDPQMAVIPSKMRKTIPPNKLNIWSMDKLKIYANLVNGQWPEYTPPVTRDEILRAMRQPADIQAVIGINAALELGLEMGDVLVDSMGRHFPIVGIIEPINPKDDAWWGDLTIFDVYRRPGINEDTIFLSLLIHPSSLRNYYLQHEVSWRILVDHELFTPDNINILEQKIINLKNRVNANGALLRTNIPNLLEKYREDIITIRVVVMLISMQALVFLLYGLILLETLVLHKAEGEISTMVGRGSGILQIVAIIGTEGLILAILAGTFFGPLLAYSLLSFMFNFSIDYFDSNLRMEGWLYAMLGAGIGWIALLICSFPISRRNILTFKKRKSRLDNRFAWQKYFLDLFLIAFSGLVYWQLSDSGSFILNRIRDTDIIDPLLLLSPTIFFFSISLIFMRIYPYIFNLLFWMFKSFRGIVIQMSLVKLSRDSIRPGHTIFLISIAVSTMLFSSSYENSIQTNQVAISKYLTGADIRLSKKDLSLEDVVNIPGVIDVTQVFRRETQIRTGETMTFLGVDPATFPNIVSFPPGMTTLKIQDIIKALSYDESFLVAQQPENLGEEVVNNPYLDEDTINSQIPAVFSYDAVTQNVSIGDQQAITLVSSPINLNIRGLIQNFPTVINAFVLVDLGGLEKYIDLERPEFHSSHEIWMNVDPEKRLDIINIPFIQENLLSDSFSQLQLMQENGFTKGAIGAFRLNTLILSLFSMLIFALLMYFSTVQRRHEFGILRAEGVSSRQFTGMLLAEGSVIIVFGIFIGTLIGAGLVYIMRPYINMALLRSLPQMKVYEIDFDWMQITLRYGVLTLSYLVSMGFTVFILGRMELQKVLRMGEE